MSEQEKHPIWQGLMDRAYAKWQKGGELEGLDKAAFFKALPYAEKLAVAFGNFNYQVCNGGFRQWSDNGYRKVHSAFIRHELDARCGGAENPFGRQVLEIILSTSKGGQYSKDKADQAYYEINDKWMDEVEAILAEVTKEKNNG